MRLSEVSKEFSLKTGIKTVWQIMLVMLVMSNALLAFKLVTTTSTHRETLVPPTINKTFWVDGEKVSPEYLEQMGAFLISLAFNNTPVSAENNAKTLLKYVGPASYGQIERYLMANVVQIKRINTSTIFSPRAISVIENMNAVSFTGVQTTYIADRRVSEVSKTYLAIFGYEAGKTYIKDLRETDPKSPFRELTPEEAKAVNIPDDEVVQEPKEETVISETAPPASHASEGNNR